MKKKKIKNIILRKRKKKNKIKQIPSPEPIPNTEYPFIVFVSHIDTTKTPTVNIFYSVFICFIISSF